MSAILPYLWYAGLVIILGLAAYLVIQNGALLAPLFAWLMRHPLFILIALLVGVAGWLGFEDRLLMAQVSVAQSELKTCHAANVQADGLLRAQDAAIEAQHAQLVQAQSATATAQSAAQIVHTRTVTVLKTIQLAAVPVKCHAAVQWATGETQSILKEWNHAPN